jgi:hypothetical protein
VYLLHCLGVKDHGHNRHLVAVSKLPPVKFRKRDMARNVFYGRNQNEMSTQRK